MTTDELVLVPLTRDQCVHLADLAAAAARKRERQRAASTYIPPPGKRHADEEIAKRWRTLERLLRKAALPQGVTP